MDKRLLDRDDLIIPETCSSLGNGVALEGKPSSITFYMDFNNPMTKELTEGRKVTYEVIEGDNGELYAINIEIEDDSEAGKTLQ